MTTVVVNMSKEHFREELEALFIREKAQFRPVYVGQSPQLDKRRKVVDFIIEVGKAVGLNISAITQAIHFYHHFDDWHSIDETQLFSVALGAIRLAGKVNHNISMLWSASNLAVYLPRREYKTFSKALLLRIELMIAMHHGWRLMMIVPTDYLDLFKVVSVTNTDILFEAAYAVVRNSPRYGGVTYDDLKKDQNRLNFLAETAKMDVNRFIDIIYTVVMRLEPSKMEHHTPSLIAGAILMLSRLACGMQLWNCHFRALTRYTAKDVLTCCNDYILDKGADQLKEHIIVVGGKLGTACLTEAFEGKVCHETGTVVLRTLKDDSFMC